MIIKTPLKPYLNKVENSKREERVIAKPKLYKPIQDNEPIEETSESSKVYSKKVKKHEFLKRKSGKISSALNTTNKAPKTSRRKKPEPKVEPKASDERKTTPKPARRKFLEKGKGKGGGKGNAKEVSPEKPHNLPDKAVQKASKISRKESSQKEKSEISLKEVNNRIKQWKKYIGKESDENGLSDSDSEMKEGRTTDIEIQVFQKLPLPIRGLINREIEK